MTLTKLRKEVCKRLKIKSFRQLYNYVSDVTVKDGIYDRDVALLLLAHRLKIDVTKPRYAVSQDKLNALNEHLKIKITTSPIPSIGYSTKKINPSTKFRRLLNFKGKYPEVFYDRLEDEINTAYSNPALPNAVLMLSRKLIENLVYNLLEYKFDGPQINLYYDNVHGRAHDFSVLLRNLQRTKADFDRDQHDLIDKFLTMAWPFRLDANSKVHRIMEYLASMREIRKLKIVDMTQILLKLIDRVKIRGKP